MGERKAVPSIEGWFTEGEKPHLIVTQCKQCRTFFFPKESMYCRNPKCSSTKFEEVPLSRTGTIWSFTEHFYEPPEPFLSPDPFVPYTIAAVELDNEKMVVLGQVADGVAHADLTTGQEVELVVEKIYEIDDVDYTVWKWKPVAA
jgi:uncharacterized OB-fold protein